MRSDLVDEELSACSNCAVFVCFLLSLLLRPQNAMLYYRDCSVRRGIDQALFLAFRP